VSGCEAWFGLAHWLAMNANRISETSVLSLALVVVIL